MDYKKTTLPNGLRIITVHRNDAPSAAAMVLVGVGSRHEDGKEAGIAHFIEHNVFKGTEVRNRRGQISEEIESLGGVMNAATGHEFTYYWAKAAASKLSGVIDVVMDISQNMTFPEQDLEIERGNVIEEINMANDNPMQRVTKDYLDFVWDGHPVGRRISGTKETVGAMTRGQMKKFVQNNYTPERMIVVVAGKFEEQKVKDQISEFYRGRGDDRSRDVEDRALEMKLFQEFQTEPRVYLDTDQTQQTHFCLGFKTFGRRDERRFTLDLVNTVFGQGMSSRLFYKIREELGLAYYVGSENWDYDETGIWFVRAGVDNNRAEQAIEAVMAEFKRLKDERVGEEELRKAKEYLKGKTLLGVETSDELGGWYGFQELLEDKVLSPQEYNEKVESVTAEDVQKLVGELVREDRLNLGLVGPVEGEEKLRELIR